MPQAVADRALEIRAEVVREAISAREIDPLLGLSMVAWPPPGLEAASTRRADDKRPLHFHTGQTRQRALELLAAGWTQREAGEELGVPRTTIQMWARADRRHRGVEGSCKHAGRNGHLDGAALAG